MDSDFQSDPWSRFLSRWTLATVVMIFGLIGVFGGGVGFDNSLPPEYSELVLASRRPDTYRLAMLFDALNWVMIGGVLLGFAGLFWKRAPIRSLFLAATGSGMLAGIIGGLLRLRGTGDLAARYAAASTDQQASVVQSYLVLSDIVGSHFQAGQALQAAGFLLIGWVALSSSRFPRRLGALTALPGVTSGGLFIWNTVAPFSFPLVMIHVLVSAIVYSAIAWTFWRHAPVRVSAPV